MSDGPAEETVAGAEFEISGIRTFGSSLQQPISEYDQFLTVRVLTSRLSSPSVQFTVLK
jgi:hypothetical protein